MRGFVGEVLGPGFVNKLAGCIAVSNHCTTVLHPLPRGRAMVAPSLAVRGRDMTGSSGSMTT